MTEMLKVMRAWSATEDDLVLLRLSLGINAKEADVEYLPFEMVEAYQDTSYAKVRADVVVNGLPPARSCPAFLCFPSNRDRGPARCEFQFSPTIVAALKLNSDCMGADHHREQELGGAGRCLAALAHHVAHDTHSYTHAVQGATHSDTRFTWWFGRFIGVWRRRGERVEKEKSGRAHPHLH